ncbi:MAG: DUF4982 domain-containing protein [Prevotella sp.]|nr:DUF4982 domain-containing protein [Prevotella sp.]
MRKVGFVVLNLLLAGVLTVSGQSRQPRAHLSLDEGWQFAFGHAADPAKDYGCGTEYFNYLTKAGSIHNEGPYSLKFDASGWKRVDLPHDWVVDLPFAPEASHSHGYKTVGWKYPATSVGWYRKVITLDKADRGPHYELQFDGIFRDARIWVNGFYIGGEESGYASQTYDITEYLNYGDASSVEGRPAGENLICVRVDASLEEGWFYEGAGIYRHVWLNRTAPVYVKTFGTFVHADLQPPFDAATLTIEATIGNDATSEKHFTLQHSLLDADGRIVGTTSVGKQTLPGKDELSTTAAIRVERPHLWSLDDPYLYQVKTDVIDGDGSVVDTYTTTTGIRHLAFDADRGFFLNGQPVKLLGVNMHQDHAGVGAAVPDAMQAWTVRQLQSIGCNAIRTSHNPATPELLDACDRLGMLVLEENRLTGVNDFQRRQLSQMIRRDRNHPSIILWSIGNEEWGIEWNDYGRRIAAAMREFCHRMDSTRLACVASSSGPTINEPMDVAGYNYILQNPVEEHRRNYPKRIALGSEETTGCGTRSVYFDDVGNGRMAAINRSKQGPDSLFNCIERGWQFYHQRPWVSGLFYWTGFDYRGEPNPLAFPATGSEFGILDYCGFPKDEAYYLKAWWTDDPVLHLLPHWNLQGHEGEEVDVWAYSNCAEVELIVNGRKLGRKAMPKDGHLSWKAVYQPGYIEARGYDGKGRRIKTERIETTGVPERMRLSADRTSLRADNRDVAVCTIKLQDRRGRFVPTACEEVELEVSGPVRILGVGNGDPAWKAEERPADRDARKFCVRTFNGLAQVLLQTTREAGPATLSCRQGKAAGQLQFNITNK